MIKAKDLLGRVKHIDDCIKYLNTNILELKQEADTLALELKMLDLDQQATSNYPLHPNTQLKILLEDIHRNVLSLDSPRREDIDIARQRAEQMIKKLDHRLTGKADAD